RGRQHWVRRLALLRPYPPPPALFLASAPLGSNPVDPPSRSPCTRRPARPAALWMPRCLRPGRVAGVVPPLFPPTAPCPGAIPHWEVPPMPTVSVPLTAAPLDQLHRCFLAILPRIQLHAQIVFRHEKCPDKRSDAVAEAVALAWHWFVRLSQQGKDATLFVAALA